MVRFARPHLIPSPSALGLPIAGGGVAAVLAAIFVAILPDWRLEGAVSATGLPTILPFAQPPLGHTARLLLMGAAAAAAGAVVWAALFLIWGPGGLLYRAPAGDAPSVRRADAHPDAPPRRPLTAADLGVPPPPAERAIPADLDQPLAAFHPEAIPDVPRAPVRPVPALATPMAEAREAAPVQMAAAPVPDVPAPTHHPLSPRRIEAGDAPPPTDIAEAAGPEMRRIETFELTPMVRTPPQPPAPVETPTVEALLQRLERGTRRRHVAR